MSEFAISVGELTAKHGRKKAGQLPPKFRDPATGNTWSGRGKPPHWIAGKDRQSFAI
jgi:DNA-binding protein H-NS